MVRERCIRLAGLLGERSGGQILLEGQFSSTTWRVRERLGQRRIVHHGDSVADALGARDFDGLANGFRPADFTGVTDDAQTFAASQIERGAKIGGGKRKFVTAHAERDDARPMQLRTRMRATSMAASGPNCRAASKIHAVRSRRNSTLSAASRMAVKFASTFCMRRSITPAEIVISA